MEFPRFFYLPAQVGGLTEPSVLRFEFIQPVALSGVQPIFVQATKQSFLSDAAWTILLHQLVKFTSGKPAAFCLRAPEETGIDGNGLIRQHIVVRVDAFRFIDAQLVFKLPGIARNRHKSVINIRPGQRIDNLRRLYIDKVFWFDVLLAVRANISFSNESLDIG
jgi:hypothetical protein